MKYRGWLAVVGIVAIVLLYLVAFEPQRRLAAGDPPMGLRLSRAETMMRAHELAGRLWPDRRNVQLSPEFTQTPIGMAPPGASIEPVKAAWQVTCEDIRGVTLGTITWNAQTGDLMSIVAGCVSAGEPIASFPKMKRAESHKVSQQWMRELAGPRNGAVWRELAEKSGSKLVLSEWVARDRKAHLYVNSTSGELAAFRMTASPLHAGTEPGMPR